MSQKKWNWQQKDWPNFSYNANTLESLESSFLTDSGYFLGVLKYINDSDKKSLRIGLIGDEAYKTSEIEGEILNRDSLQSSIKRNFGLAATKKPAANKAQAEEGIAMMMANLYQNFSKRLTHKQLFDWHKMLMNGRKNLKVGSYRTHNEAMQVVSGKLHDPKIHFEAPPSKQVKSEMRNFLKWFNSSHDLPALTRAAIAHFYFVSIHPFEDGNGRIGRAIVLKSLSQSLNEATLISLSYAIEKKKKNYYAALERSNTSCKIDSWLKYFTKTIIEAQDRSKSEVEFLIAKMKFYDRFKELINERQKKVLDRMFREGISGFTGGLSAENYIKITKTSRATATRDLQELVELKALRKHGEGRWTRYEILL